MMWLEDIQTQFVRDRVQETSFEDRTYVYDLYLIESLQRGRGLGWAFHASGRPRQLYACYPAEAECIRLEITEGRYIDPARFTAERLRFAAAWRAREKAYANAQEREEAALEVRRQAEEEAQAKQERKVWQQMGGSL
jgi:hypothetical protein